MADETGGKLQSKEKVLRGAGDVRSDRFYVLDLKILDDGADAGPKESSL
jgi:hypothetical protein